MKIVGVLVVCGFGGVGFAIIWERFEIKDLYEPVTSPVGDKKSWHFLLRRKIL